MIYLVPEISLTEQIINKFFQTFGPERIAIIHSQIKKEEKLYYWKKIRDKKIDIIVGARSAVFAPVRDLGLIIVDEESDPSYKSNSTPRYNARQVAFIRAQKEKALMLMGTATPSIETFYFAKKGNFHLFELKSRYNKKPLPEFNVIDLSMDEGFSKKVPISETLIRQINQALSQKQQVILFLNRRGFSHFVFCRNCGFFYTCPHCNVSLRYHKGDKLICHWCGYTRKAGKTCEQCGQDYLVHGGAGTQKIESVIARVFPKYHISRLDTDAVRKKGKLKEIISQFESGDIHLLTGTQMLSKGHNFPDVTLVGILFIDELLNFPDFRNTENAFQLIVQVAGRAGRDKWPGQVYIQTFLPDHYAIKYAVNYDFLSFYKTELGLRKDLNFPPFCRLIKLTLEGKHEETVQNRAGEIYQKLKSFDTDAQLLGPIPSPLYRVKGKYRFQILIKTTSPASIKERIRHLNFMDRDVHLIIDVDPYSLL
ncbi:MAG: primosomal protein N' [Spirochaetes bacterium]|nr:primosomal protein N' [Spirochaetota bacterium]